MTIRPIRDEMKISDRLLNNGAVSMLACVVLISIVNESQNLLQPLQEV